MLLEGHTGIGKSAIVGAAAAQLGIELIVLDLSLLEPPDLVGIPVLDGNRRAVHAVPRGLPAGGSGILLLEELNRAERYMQQPALQLLTARRLHTYELPAGWLCVAAINPEDADYHVTPLDPALRARFLTIRVHASRAAWMSWARTANIHQAVLALISAHDRVFEEVPPRTWTYVSNILSAIPPRERVDLQLARDLVSGYLPQPWVDALAQVLTRHGGEFDFRVLDLVATYHTDATLRRQVRRLVAEGRTDAIDEIAHRLRGALAGPEAGVMLDAGELDLESFEQLIADLPGDTRELLQEALGGNVVATGLIDVDAEAFVRGTAGARDIQLLASWAGDPLLQHRAHLALTAIRAFLDSGEVRAGDLAPLRTVRALAARLGHAGKRLRRELASR